jgi:hypothetical protein
VIDLERGVLDPEAFAEHRLKPTISPSAIESRFVSESAPTPCECPP